MTDELRKVAEAATRGSWAASKGKARRVTARGKIICTAVLANGPGRANVKSDEEARANAMFIATFDPPTVLAILDRLTTLEAAIAMHERNEQIHGDTLLALNDAENKIVALEAERAKGEARVKWIEQEARRFANFYAENTDGRNTFVIFADKIAALGGMSGRNSTAEEQAKAIAWGHELDAEEAMTQTLAADLAACPNPWCGNPGKVEVLPAGRLKPMRFLASCSWCGICPDPAPTEAEAIAAWNTRPALRAKPAGEVVGVAGNLMASYRLWAAKMESDVCAIDLCEEEVEDLARHLALRTRPAAEGVREAAQVVVNRVGSLPDRIKWAIQRETINLPLKASEVTIDILRDCLAALADQPTSLQKTQTSADQPASDVAPERGR